ncbi:hypothetical protein [uncultured Amnibacterium sp.]|uniref:hypothetical protein n=1 Tax=uncultured Amnibacterium sp. TaxID=1631851 RepID=UPI0035CBDBF4
MTDAPNDYDQNHPTQAEGEDPDAAEPSIVLEQQGKPSSAEGEDPDAPAAHEVLDPVQPD